MFYLISVVSLHNAGCVEEQMSFLCCLGKSSSAASQSAGSDWATNVRIASVVIYCIICVLGTVGNGLVIYVTGFKMKRTVNSVWFLNLALADFLFTAFLVFTIISTSQDHQWNLGRVMCKLNTFVIVVNMFASVFLLLAISLDRCLATWVVVWAQNKRTVRKAQVICAVIWAVAVACSTPYATFREVLQIYNVNRCTYSVRHTSKEYFTLAIFRFVAGFLIPFLGIFVSYLAIYVRARRLQRKRNKRSRRIIIAVILAFFICWLPFHVCQLIELLSKNNQVLSNVRKIGPLSVCLAFLNSCLNPVLYVFMCEEFQKKLKQSICHVLESALAEEHLSFINKAIQSASHRTLKCNNGKRNTFKTL
uniref:G-protein coupled receptors family 1 profile domain-containing protein n=1 Tax=Sphaeramia orbicularis TaxID=375764 RepID=A0A673AJ26_9TELE